MATTQELYDIYRAQEAQYGNASDPNAYAAQFLQNAINLGVDPGQLTQLAQMVNPSFYAQPEAIQQFSDTARSSYDAIDGQMGNNTPAAGGLLSVNSSGEVIPTTGWTSTTGDSIQPEIPPITQSQTMPTTQELYDLYRSQEAQYGNPSDPNAYAAQFLQNAINLGVDPGNLIELAQMVNPSMYANSSDYAAAAAANDFSSPRWTNLAQFSDNARAAYDARDGQIGNNIPSGGGFLGVNNSGQVIPTSGWTSTTGGPVNTPVSPISRQATYNGAQALSNVLGSFGGGGLGAVLGGSYGRDPFANARYDPTNPGDDFGQGNRPTGGGWFASQADLDRYVREKSGTGSQFDMSRMGDPLSRFDSGPGGGFGSGSSGFGGMPQAPSQPYFQGQALNIDRPQAPQIPQPGNLPGFNFQAPQAPQMYQAQGQQPLSFQRPNAPGSIGELNAPQMPGQVQAPQGGLNRPQAPGMVQGAQAPGLPTALQGPDATINRPQGPGGVESAQLQAYSRNPGVDQALETLQRKIGTMRDEGLQSVRSNSIGVGGLGGSRQGVAEGAVIKGANDSYADAAGQLLYSDYTDSQNRALQKYQADQGFNLGRGGLEQQRYGVDAGLATSEGNLRNQNFATQVQQNLGLGGLANDQYKAQQDFALGQGNLGQARYATDAGLSSTEGQLANQRYQTQVQEALGRGGLANDQFGTMANYNLGRAGLGQQQYASDLGYDINRAGVQNQRYGLDLQNAQNQNQFASSIYGTQMQGALGQGGLENARYGLQNDQNIGLGNLANQRYAADLGYAGTIGGLQNQRYGQDQAYSLGLGGLGQQAYGTQMQGYLGQGALTNQRYGMDQNYAVNQGQLQLGNQQAQNNFYTQQRGLDYEGLRTGAGLVGAAQTGDWAGLTNANGIYSPYTGFGNATVYGGGGGLAGAIGGALTGASLAKNFNWFGT